MVTGQEIYQSALATARLSYEGYGLTTLDTQIDAREDFLACGVEEVDIVEDDFVFQRLDGFGLGLFFYRIVSIEYLIDAHHGSHTLGDVVTGLGEVFQRLDDAVKYDHVEDERRGINGRLCAEDECTTIPQDKDDEAGAEKFAHGMRRSLPHLHACRSVAKLVGGAVETLLHLTFCRKGFDDAHTAKGLFELRHRLAPFVLCVQTLTLKFAADASHSPAESRQDNDSEDSELPRGVDEHAEVADEQYGILMSISRLPVTEFSISPTSPLIRAMMSPLRSSLKKESGRRVIL